MPVKVKKLRKGGFRVTHGSKTSAKRTTKAKAMKQVRLLNAIRHGWKPKGRKRKK